MNRPVAGRPIPRPHALVAAVAIATALPGCSLLRGSPPVSPADVPSAHGAEVPVVAGAAAPSPQADRIASLAEGFAGAPYRFGGASPAGFDCSGLVWYVHALAGYTLPRTAAGQMLESRRVAREDLVRGDLVFFALGGSGRAIDHVAIYLGDGEIIHAPRSGRPVGRDRLDDRWFAERFAGAGRFWTR
jgi:murein DD-endopeptidase